MEWLNFRHLYAFWAVCRYGGFSKAAARIHVSQSTVSEQVAHLEGYFDEELIERSTRSLKVTRRGAELLEYADEIFARSAQVNRVFRDQTATTGSRHMRVGMVGGISRNFVFNRIIGALRDEREARIDLIDGSFDELTRLLGALDLDLILSLDRPRQQDLLTMEYVRVQSSPVRLVGTPELIGQVTAARSDALPIELFMFRHPFEGRPLAQRCAERYGLDPTIPVWTDDISLLRFLANSGHGLALVPEIGVWEDSKAGRVEGLEVPGDPGIDIYAIFSNKGTRRDLAEAFLADVVGE
jgi:LysR family transcriptional activator of nhaA